MTEERVTSVSTPRDGDSHTTVISDRPRSGGGWIIGLLIIALLAVGLFFFIGMADSEAAKDNAIGNAAQDVGDAARDVGQAAKNAADNVGTTTRDATKDVELPAPQASPAAKK